MEITKVNSLGVLHGIEKSVKDKKDEIDYILDYVEKRKKFSDADKKEVKTLIKQIQKNDGEVSDEGVVTCYYALSKYNKKSFETDGTVGGGSDKIILSVKETESLKKFGDKILTLFIPIEDLFFAAETKETLLLKIPFKNKNRKINLKQYM